ncbi:unnamed protein product [Rotaria socialis]|uniref:Uncharacterized protein n=2 Tax=Rotaria socialis TaxID=392032 RepID=A0A820KD32_9BILA|nr:unnamed protein product [Rotaria socialis]
MPHGFSSQPSSLPLVAVQSSTETFFSRWWFVAVVGLVVSATVIISVGIIVTVFIINSSRATMTSTSCFTSTASQPSNTWYLVGNMSTPRYYHTSTFISQDGSVLITGGINAGFGLASIERYIPSTGCFQSSGSMSSVRYYHTADSMSSLSSWIIIAGGYNGASAVGTADIYDPATESIVTIYLASAIYAQRSAIVGESQLVLIGGVNTIAVTSRAQVFSIGSPSAFAFAINTMSVGLVWHTATPLQNTSDLVLITGGTDGVSYYGIVSLYQGSSHAFIPLTPGVSLPTARVYHTGTYVPHPINQVLIAGGSTNSATYLNTFALFDVDTLQFVTITTTMLSPRGWHTSTLLPNGKILIIGGYDGTTSIRTCELIDPDNNYVSTQVASLNVARHIHTAAILSTSCNGTVLVCGGYKTGIGALNSCEVYVV